MVKNSFGGLRTKGKTHQFGRRWRPVRSIPSILRADLQAVQREASRLGSSRYPIEQIRTPHKRSHPFVEEHVNLPETMLEEVSPRSLDCEPWLCQCLGKRGKKKRKRNRIPLNECTSSTFGQFGPLVKINPQLHGVQRRFRMFTTNHH